MAGKDDILYTVGIDNSDVKKKNKETKESIEKASSSGEKSLGKLNAGSAVAVAGLAAVAAGAVAVVGAVKLVSSGIEDFNVQARAENKLESVLKSTKNVAGLTAIELKNMASELQTVTAVGDEAIIGAQSLMLTFTNIGKEIIPDATEAVLNMSHVLGTDLISSTTMLSKALNDPIAGISAMSRAGIQFTQDQKDMIKELVEGGRAMDAQKIILGELEIQFGNAARNFRTTAEGVSISISNIFGDLSESIGEGFFDESLDELQGLLQSLTDASPELASLAKSFGSIAGSLAAVPINALTGWIDLFHAYSAGSAASVTGLAKPVAVAQENLDEGIKSAYLDLGQWSMDERKKAGITDVNSLKSIFESFKKMSDEELAEVSLRYEDIVDEFLKLEPLYKRLSDEQKNLRTQIIATNKEDVKTKDKKTVVGSSAIVDLKLDPTVDTESNPLFKSFNEGLYSSTSEFGEMDTQESFYSGFGSIAEIAIAEQTESIVALNEKSREEQRQAEIEYYNNSISLMNNSENAIIAIHKIWNAESTDIFLKGMSNLSTSTRSILENIGNLTGNSSLQAGGSILSGFGFASAGFSIASTIAGFFTDNDTGDSTPELDSQSRTTARANIVSNAPRNLEVTNNITFAAPVIGEVATREFVLNEVVPYVQDAIESVL